MVSLLISKLGRAISGQGPMAVFETLKRRRYLSKSGLRDRDAVVAALRQVQDSWPASPADGWEMWRDMEAVLEGNGFLNPAGVAAARKYVSRRSGFWSRCTNRFRELARRSRP
jgi:hypothetical protein